MRHARTFITALLISLAFVIFARCTDRKDDTGNHANAPHAGHQDRVNPPAKPAVDVPSAADKTKPLPEGFVDLGNKSCPVMGGEVNPAIFIDHEGYRVYFCCPGCDKAYREDPAKYLAIMAKDPAVAARIGNRKEAPEVVELGNVNCPVMDNPVAEGQSFEFRGFRINICCPSCAETFKADPEKYFKVLAEDEAVKEKLVKGGWNPGE